MPTSKRSSRSSNRELVNTGTDKRYVRRDAKGQFKDVLFYREDVERNRERSYHPGDPGRRAAGTPG